MSVNNFKRFTCVGCGKVEDCKESDLTMLKLKTGGGGAMKTAEAPRGWITISVDARDAWKDTCIDIPREHACSADCAAKGLRELAESIQIGLGDGIDISAKS